MTLTKDQRTALKRLYHRAVIAYSYGPQRNGVHYMGYRAFRRSVLPGPPGCVLVPYAGMWVGIETDGYTHS